MNVLGMKVVNSGSSTTLVVDFEECATGSVDGKVREMMESGEYLRILVFDWCSVLKRYDFEKGEWKCGSTT